MCSSCGVQIGALCASLFALRPALITPMSVVMKSWGRLLILAGLALPLGRTGTVWAEARPFTVADDIELSRFGDPNGGQAEAVRLSPSGDSVAVYTERGRIDVNRPEGELRIYRMHDIGEFLGSKKATQPPPPIWTLTRSSGAVGPMMIGWRWLKDSSGIAFLEPSTDQSHSHRLFLADIKNKTIEALTPESKDVRAFDIRDAMHFVYAAADSGLRRKAAAERELASIVATGRPLIDLLFPADTHPESIAWADRSSLWAMIDGHLAEVRDPATGHTVTLFSRGQDQFSLSPDGESLVTALPLTEVPSAWESLYRPPFEGSPYKLHAGPQDLSVPLGSSLVDQYVIVNLRNGSITPLVDAPTGFAAGWFSGGAAAWSPDGKAVLLHDAYADSKHPWVPCVALVVVAPRSTSCVEALQGEATSGYATSSRYVAAIGFEGRRSDQVYIHHYLMDGTADITDVYTRQAKSGWRRTLQRSGPLSEARDELQFSVKEGLNDPPILTVTDTQSQKSRMLWNPNPQLDDITLGQASVYRWKDSTGLDWKGGLYLPVPLEQGRRYPLVLQTHGFSEIYFTPSGIYPTTFAARTLAASGMVVLQVGECLPAPAKDSEGACHVRGYESAVKKLVGDGFVDPERIGIIGFSRSCYHVMETLTASPVPIKAASITDGVMGDYFQYLTFAGSNGDAVANEHDAMIGARPFGVGLQQWFKRSPLFNIDRVSAPLLVVGAGPQSVLAMWGPYAALRLLHKPVELVMLNTDEHVLTNPSVRLASQGGSVDWFRFWLQDYEDPDPAKAEQYVRWRELRKLQATQDAERAGESKESPKVD